AATAGPRRHPLRQRYSPPTSTSRSPRRPPATPIDGHHALMLEYAGSQRGGLQRHRDEGLALVAVLRSLDWVLLAGVSGLVARGLWVVSGVTRCVTQRDPNCYPTSEFIY